MKSPMLEFKVYKNFAFQMKVLSDEDIKNIRLDFGRSLLIQQVLFYDLSLMLDKIFL